MKTAWKTANMIMLLAFIASVIVQLNDPDPWRWVVIWGAAALATLLALAGRAGWRLPAAVALAALLWAATLVRDVIGRVRLGELFEAFEMKDARVEVGREFGGLLIIAFWMAVLLIAARRTGRGGASTRS